MMPIGVGVFLESSPLGPPPPPGTPSALDFSQAANSQLYFLLLLW